MTPDSNRNRDELCDEGDRGQGTSPECSGHDIAYHLAWVLETPYQELPGPLSDRLCEIIRRTAGKKNVALSDLTVNASYVALVVESPPHHSPQHLATWLKNVSAKRFEQTYPKQSSTISYASGYYTSSAATKGRAGVREYLETHQPADNR